MSRGSSPSRVPRWPGAAAALTLVVPSEAAAAAASTCPGQHATLATLVAVVMGFGALGGFVDGLTADIPYRVRFQARSIDIGSLGDALAGATAAIAIFTVGSALFPEVELECFNADISHSIRIVAISVLSGYAGVRLLNPLTRKLVEQISFDKARQVGETIKVRDEELIISVKDGDRRLSRFDAEKQTHLAAGNTARLTALLADARRSYEVALKLDPLDTEALMGLAKVARRRAEIPLGDAEAAWTEAIHYLDKVTQKNPRAARALYNKACYKLLRRSTPESQADALKDLEAAIRLVPGLKSPAATDPDLASVQESPAFKAIVA